MNVPETGQRQCYDAAGREIPCRGTGQDGEFARGRAWPDPRFEPVDDVVLDRLTGLLWTRAANAAGYPLTWNEAFDFVVAMNRALRDVVRDRLTGLVWRRAADLTVMPVTWTQALAAVRELNERARTHIRWRLPDINELESLVDCSRHTPALPAEAMFTDLRDGYWSSTTSAYEPDWAWALYLDKGAVGVGQKSGAYFHVWAVTDDTTYPVGGREAIEGGQDDANWW